ncbi:MAG: PHP domain-containing protein [Planctomycetota bacterium]
MEFDLHIHTRYSFDCRMKPEKIIRVAKARGLAGIGVVDHNSLEGALETERIAAGRLIVIPGIEVGTMMGDIIGFFIREPITVRDPFEVIEAIHAQGGVVVLPHPFRGRMAIPLKLAERVDVIEGYNARSTDVAVLHPSKGEEAVVKVAEAHGKPTVAGSDAHFYWEIGRARTIIPASTPEEVRGAILDGNTLLVGRRTPFLWSLLSGMLRLVRGGGGRRHRPKDDPAGETKKGA